MQTRHATVKKVDKTLKALKSVSVTPAQTHLKPDNSSTPSSKRGDGSEEESDGWETDLECDEVCSVTQKKYQL